MCYSAQVIQTVRKLHRRLGIRLDYDECERLFFQRLDEPGLIISRGFEANFDDPSNDQERRIKSAIDEHRSRSASQFEHELFSQKTRLVNAKRSLSEKETKKAREDERIATKKIAALTAKLGNLRRTDVQPDDNRIFPMVYAGVIIRKDGANVLTPMRYFCRPQGKPASYDRQFPGLYNARRDNLDKFWKGQFGTHHAVMVVESFYENVASHVMQHRELEAGETPQNVVLQFTPSPPQAMLIACLWSHWTGAGATHVNGFAAITDEPPADVAAAGHDRCIINVQPENVDAWLTPLGRQPAELQAILSGNAVSAYQHEVSRVA
jgi:putative SOS response-associated peptidase YedK